MVDFDKMVTRIEEIIQREREELDVIYRRVTTKSHALLEWTDFVERRLDKWVTR